MNAPRSILFLVAGVLVVVLMEDDLTAWSQLAELGVIDYVFLLLWGALFGVVLAGIWHVLDQGRRVLFALRARG